MKNMVAFAPYFSIFRHDEVGHCRVLPSLASGFRRSCRNDGASRRRHPRTVTRTVPRIFRHAFRHTAYTNRAHKYALPIRLTSRAK